MGAVRIGDGFTVNTTTVGMQYGGKLAVLADGRFAVAWTDASGSGGDNSPPAVRVRLFKADGTPATAELLVNTTTLYQQWQPEIASLDTGGFVVVWDDQSGGQSFDGSAVRGQVFAADGSRVGGELLLIASDPSLGRSAAVAGLSSGRFATAWFDQAVDGYDILLQVHEADGRAAGPRIVANTTTAGNEVSPEFDALPDGGFLLRWLHQPASGVPYVNMTQRFGADGQPVGPEFRLVVGDPALQMDAEAAAVAADGRIGVVANSDSGVWAQVLDAAGTPIAPAVQLPAPSSWIPDIVAVDGAGFVVTWRPVAMDRAGQFWGQVLRLDGSAAGAEFSITGDTQGQDLSAAALAGDRLVTTWTTLGYQGPEEVRAQFLQIDIVPPAPPVITTATVDVNRVVVAGTAEAGSLVRIRDGHQVVVAMATADATGAFQATTSILENGEHQLTAVAVDVAQNTGAPSAAVTAVVQTFFYADVTTTLGPQYLYLVLSGAGDIDGTGNAHDNSLVGNAGSNVLAGLAGDDIYVVQDAMDRVVENAGEGLDTIYTSVSMVLPDSVENLILTGAVDLGATGNAAHNVVIGNAGANALAGGAGDDIYGVQGGEDLVIERAGEGFDTVYAAGSYALPDFVEALILQGSAFFGVGNAADNVLIGTDEANVFFGGGGTDLFAGGAGNDIYAVDSAQDAIVETWGGGTDVVVASVDCYLPDAVEVLDLVGAARNGFGNAWNNALNGNEYENLLFGSWGEDYLSGSGGDDTLNGGHGSDQLWGGSGRDTFIFANTGEGPDFIGDFTRGEDQLVLQNLPFAKGRLVDGVSFVSAPVLPQALRGPVVFYETSTGYLLYDSNGADADGRSLLAVIGLPALSVADLAVG
jgi:Ca2+-binding RTX toxin-like protein